MRPALKWLLLCKWCVLLLPQNDCIWTLICTLRLEKTKFDAFYNVVDANKTRICREWFLPFHARMRLNWDSWEVRLMFQCVLRSFQKKRFRIFEITDNHFSKVHHTLLNVMVFMVFSFQSFAKHCSNFFFFLNLIVAYSYARSLFAVTLKIGKFILYFLFFISTFFVPALPYSWDWGHQL